MARFPTITLPIGTEFVLTREIPLLIADALYPDANFLDQPVIDLYKIDVASEQSGSWVTKLNPFPQPPDWYTPLSEKDYQVLHSIWFHLPKLEYPISREGWEPYAKAFGECGTECGFDLKENCVEWLVEPNGYQKRFFELNSYSHNIAGMWMNDDAVEGKLMLQCGMAEMEHIVLLRDAIKKGEVRQLDPITHAPAERFRPFGKIPVEEFIFYSKKFNISVCVESYGAPIEPENPSEMVGSKSTYSPEKGFSEDESEGCADKSEVHHDGSSETNIPGKMPKVGIRKLAIKAAWQIECDTQKLATSKQVIEMLQSWVEGDYPELLEKIPYGVKWVTGKGEERYFDKEACGKALDTWQKSRQ